MPFHSPDVSDLMSCLLLHVDVEGVTLQGTKMPKVLAERGAKNVPGRSSDSRENTKLHLSGSAASESIPQMFISKGVNLQSGWTKGGPQGAKYTTSKIDGKILEQHLDHFLEYTQCSP